MLRNLVRFTIERGFVIAALLILSCSLSAQLPTATVLGVVTDDSGSVVPDATVVLHNTDTGQTRMTTTGADGSYRLPALAVGNYEARVTHQGFETSVLTGITLTVSQEATINFTLKVGAIEQQVTVTGGALLVNTESATLGGLVDEQKLADLPLNGRNFADLAFSTEPPCKTSTEPVRLRLADPPWEWKGFESSASLPTTSARNMDWRWEARS